MAKTPDGGERAERVIPEHKQKEDREKHTTVWEQRGFHMKMAGKKAERQRNSLRFSLFLTWSKQRQDPDFFSLDEEKKRAELL